MWILNNFFKDFLFIITPGLWTLGLIYLFPENSLLFKITLVFLLSIDSSHIYSTFWRTLFDKEEFKRSNFLYKISPLIIGFLLFLWFFLSIPYFWNFIIYLTVYHQIKQSVGLLKWYMKKNKHYDKNMPNIMYLTTITTFSIFHFRPDSVLINFYSSNDLFTYPNNILYYISLFCLLSILLYWGIVEIKNIINKKFKLNQFLLMFFYLGVQIWCFLFGKNMIEIILPQLLFHAVSYQASIIQSVENLGRNKSFWFRSLSILVFSFIIGFIANDIENKISTNPNGDFINSLILAIYMIPTLCHHLWDAFIWKKSHPDWSNIFNINNKNEGKDSEMDK